MMTRRYILLILLAALLLRLAACGQYVHVRINRLATLPPRPDHPTVRLRIARHLLLAGLTSIVTALADAVGAAPGDGSIATGWNDELARIRETLEDTSNVSALQGAASDLAELVRKLTNPANQVVLEAVITGGEPETAHLPEDKQRGLLLLRDVATPSSQLVQSLNRDVTQLLSDAADARRRVKYGGFVDNTEYRIEAASKDYEVLARSRKGVRVGEMRISATGETTVMFVQESPAHFTPRTVAADPTGVIRNLLVLSNKILRVVMSALPAAGIPVPTPEGLTVASPPAIPAEDEEGVHTSDDAVVASNLALLASDPLIIRLKEKLRGGEELTGPERAELEPAVRAALGMPPAATEPPE